MKKEIISILTILLLTYSLPTSGCSTFLICNENEFLIGHSLDENMNVPGQIYVNRRGLQKESIGFAELWDGVNDSIPKFKWVSKYGSVTYNILGREFIDGGLNEAGLYIGEMTLYRNHQYPVNPNKPNMMVTLWLQYILDSFSSVDEVVNCVSEFTLDGVFFNWHFFVSDKKGNQAIIEFINGKPVIYRNDEIPVKLLCNNSYATDLDSLKLYKGYGGNRDIDLKNKSQDYRFEHGAKMLEYAKQNTSESGVNYAFDILKQFDYGNTRWSMVFDVNKMIMYYRTNKDTDVKHLDFSSIDFSCKEPVMMLDIHSDLSNGEDVMKYFKPYDKEQNKSDLEKLFLGIGVEENKTFHEMIERFVNYPETVKCK